MTSTAPEANAPASARQQLVEVAGIPGYFGSKEGGEVSAETSQAWDGGSTKPDNLSAPSTTGNVTVAKLYRPGIHAPIIKGLAKQVGRWRTTVSVWDTDPDLGPVGEPVVYANALLVRLKRPDHDASSSDAGMFELEFAVDEEA